LANDNATTTPDELPADGPWNMDPLKLSQTLGNTHNPISDAGNGALVPDIDAPWALTGEQLAQITNNKKPPPPPAKPIDPSTQGEPFSFSSLFAKLVNTESGGKHLDDNGNLLSSNKNAKGITQVIPATGTNPGFGVTPLQNDSVEEYLRFGKDYLTAMIRNFGGDVAKGVAAYNAGPASVQKAITKYGENWLTGLPKETQNYVRKIHG
jgi:soluble lytic murein transglycosylase